MIPRYAKPLIVEALSDTPVTFVMGPRQVGKTTLVKEIKENLFAIPLGAIWA